MSYMASAHQRNGLLAQLPYDDLERMLPALKTVPLHVRQVLQKQHEPIRYVYFPNNSVMSVTTTFSEGAMTELALVGNEGMLGVEALFTDEPVAAADWVVQVADSPSDARRVSVEAFRQEYARSGALRGSIGHYVLRHLIEVYQTAGCNARHSVRERCSRLLLMVHDRLKRARFELSHEWLAVMLGVARPTVSEVAALLQEQGLIRYMHGRLTVLDREGLERAACECYAAIQVVLKMLTDSDRSVT